MGQMAHGPTPALQTDSHDFKPSSALFLSLLRTFILNPPR